MNQLSSIKLNIRTEKIDPVDEMVRKIHQAGRTHFQKSNPWESCLCALVLALEPKGKTYRFLESLPYHKNAFDKIDTLNTIANLGYFARPAQTKLALIDSRLLPCLFVTNKNTPLIILEDKGEHFKIYQNSKIKKIAKSKLTKKPGTAWIFEVYDDNKPSTSKFMREGSNYSWFRALFRRFKGTYIQIFMAGLILNLLALTTPLFIMLVYDRVIAAGSPETLPMLVVGACLAIIFECLLRKIRSRGLSWLASRMDNIVSNKIFSHLIGLSPDLIERASVAAQIARIKTFESVRDFFSGSVFLSVLELPFVVIAAIAIFAIAGPLVFVPVGMISVYGVLFYLVQRKIKISIRLAAKASSARQQFTIETFEKIRGIRGYGLSQKWQAKFRELSGKEMMAHFHLNWLGMVAETCAHALTVFSAIITVGCGVHFIWAGTITTGALVATMILVWRVLTPFYSICTMIPRLEQLRNSIIQVNKLMDLNTESMDAKSVSRLSNIQGHVSFQHVSLRYSEESDQVFTGLNFDIKAGELVAVTGENGSGKTSLLKMIKSLYIAQTGTVQIDGFDIRQLDTPDLRRQIAYMPQQHNFFQGSVCENLRIANPLASEEDIKNALQMADAWQEIASLPQGLHTIIGKYGAETFSLNLATRLSLARIYLHPASILLIDEIPNGLLSSLAGKNLKDYLARLKGKRTIFMVTYREDFMRIADTIIQLRRGEPALVAPSENILETISENVA